MTHQYYSEIPGITITFQANSDIPKFRFIGYDDQLCDSGEKAKGVLASNGSNVAEGDTAACVCSGIVLIEAGEPITSGDVKTARPLTSDLNGRAVKQAPMEYDIEQGEIIGEALNGYALDCAEAPGDLIRIRLY